MLDIIWKEQTESNACITYNMMYKIIENTEPQWEQGNQILFLQYKFHQWDQYFPAQLGFK